MEGLGYYFKELHKYPSLNLEEELVLGERMSNGDADARTKLINHNLASVIYAARKYQGRGLDFEDLIQEGNIGLMSATEKYDFRKGYRLGSHSESWIHKGIQKALGDTSRAIRLGYHTWSKLNRIHYLISKEHSSKEISEIMSYPEKKITKLMIISKEESLNDSRSYNNEDYTLMSTLPSSPHHDEYDLEQDRWILQGDLLSIAEKLPSTQSLIIKKTFGLDGNGLYTQEEIGVTQLDITRARVGQIEKRAIEKLRNMPETKELRYSARR